MAIQMRRGEKKDFQPERLKVGEFAVPIDTGEVYIKTSENVTKGVATLNSSGKLEQMPTYGDVGASASSHNHSADNITSGILPISRGGTGSSTASGAVTNLGAVPTTRTINSKPLSADITLTYADVGASSSAHTHNFSELQSKPTTLSGYGITDAVPSSRTVNSKALNTDITLDYSDVGAASSNHTHSFSELHSKPTTLSGYGITDAVPSSTLNNYYTKNETYSTDEVDNAIDTVLDSLTDHIVNTNNPHSVTLAQIGAASSTDVGNVANLNTTAKTVVAAINEVQDTSGIVYPIDIAHGGSGATTSSGALTNLGAASSADVGTVTNLNTTAKTVVGAINELYSTINSLVDADEVYY